MVLQKAMKPNFWAYGFNGQGDCMKCKSSAGHVSSPRGTEAHLKFNSGLILCRCHKTLQEAAIGGGLRLPAVPLKQRPHSAAGSGGACHSSVWQLTDCRKGAGTQQSGLLTCEQLLWPQIIGGCCVASLVKIAQGGSP